MQVVRDQSTHIYASLHEINVHLILGSILACLVVFAFMRDWRATIIAAVAIPTSVVATFGLMAAFDFTLNTVTMLALVLMVGIVIDDAIVVLENIFRFIEEKGMNGFQAAREATAEIALPVLATTLCLVVIFIPVSFMSSISGRFLYQFGLTAACAIMVSLLVSFTLTPMMSARMFGRGRLAEGPHPGGHGPGGSREGLYGWVDRTYSRVLALTLRRRALVAVIGLLVVGMNVVALPDGAAGVHPRRRGRGAVRDERHRARGRQPRGDDRGDGGDRARRPRRARRGAGAQHRRRRPARRRERRTGLRADRAARGAHLLAHPAGVGPAAPGSAARRSAATTRSAT